MTFKILIIRFSSIGDIVLTTPVIRCLKKRYFLDAEIHYVTKEQYLPILRANPNLSKIYTIRNNVDEVIKQLRAEKYNIIVDLHRSLRSTLLKIKMRDISYAVNKINFQKWLMVNLKINILPKKHVVDRYMETVSDLAVSNDGEGLDYFIPPEDEVSVHSLPEPFWSGFIGFAIGGKYTTKRLPVEKMVRICKLISRPILLLGGEEDMKRGEFIAGEAGEHVLNVSGKYNINQTASLIRQAEKIISHDTGLMHIASAFKKPIISIWGNTIPEFGMHAYYGKSLVADHRLEITGLSCRPCSKLGYNRCPKGHFKCMNLIREEDVAAAACNI